MNAILDIIALALAAVRPMLAGNSTVAKLEDAAAALVAIVQKASAAHLEITGQPIDLNVLQPIEPLKETTP